MVQSPLFSIDFRETQPGYFLCHVIRILLLVTSSVFMPSLFVGPPLDFAGFLSSRCAPQNMASLAMYFTMIFFLKVLLGLNPVSLFLSHSHYYLSLSPPVSFVTQHLSTFACAPNPLPALLVSRRSSLNAL